MNLDHLILKPHYKWFSAPYRDAEEWFGPHKTLEAAVARWHTSDDDGPTTIFVAQGYKTSRRERDEGYPNWEVDIDKAVEVRP